MIAELLAKFAEGSRTALAEALTLAEIGADSIEGSIPCSPVIGFTGAPGVGKSTLIANFIDWLRAREESVAVVLVDPTSPTTGGAFLGDRIRLQRHATDEKVFIRSLGARGEVGGLAPNLSAVIGVFQAANFDWVIVETVGVGQSETAVAQIADLVVWVTAPGHGDEIQAHKAGVVEIADVAVVTQCDRPGGGQLAGGLVAARLSGRSGAPLEVFEVSSAQKQGLEPLFSRLSTH